MPASVIRKPDVIPILRITGSGGNPVKGVRNNSMTAFIGLRARICLIQSFSTTSRVYTICDEKKRSCIRKGSRYLKSRYIIFKAPVKVPRPKEKIIQSIMAKGK
jgi:hypothetical protein